MLSQSRGLPHEGQASKHRLQHGWRSYLENRFVVTLVQKPWITCETLKALLEELCHYDVNIAEFEPLSRREFAALQMVVVLPNSVHGAPKIQDIKVSLEQVSSQQGVDVFIQQDNLTRWNRRLVVFDVDRTLIMQDVFEEVTRVAGVEAWSNEVVARGLAGDLDFYEALRERAMLLKGQIAEDLFANVNANLLYTPGAKWLCSVLKQLGYKMAGISTGFVPVLREVQQVLGLDYIFANALDVDHSTGRFTGETVGSAITPIRKQALLAMIANVEGCKISQTIAVGYGNNDIPMLKTAGLGVAFCAKTHVQESIKVRINQKDLSGVLFLMGISEQAVINLGVDAVHEP